MHTKNGNRAHITHTSSKNLSPATFHHATDEKDQSCYLQAKMPRFAKKWWLNRPRQPSRQTSKFAHTAHVANKRSRKPRTTYPDSNHETSSSLYPWFDTCSISQEKHRGKLTSLPTDTLRGEKNQSTSPTNHKPFQQIVKLGRAKAHKSRRPLGGTRGTWAK